MNLALEAFHIMQTRFPAEVLFDWWTKQLALCVTTENYRDLTLQRLQLGIKLAQLLRHRQEYPLVRRTLLSAKRCISMDNNLAQAFELCQHPQLSIYTTMLQILAQVSEKEGLVREARAYNKSIHKCLRAAPNSKAEEIIPHNFCSDGIGHVREVFEEFKDFPSALQLFNALLKCNKTEGANSIKLLEDAFERMLAKFPVLPAESKGLHSMHIAKCMYLVFNHEGEVKWLVKSAEYMQHKDCFAFYIYFRLTRLYWNVLNDKQKALESGRSAYAKAMNLYPSPQHHYHAWQASLRLASILHQVDGHQGEAARYFQEALDRLPFISASPDFIYKYQYFIERNLASLYYQSRQFNVFFQHYGQWAVLAAVPTRWDAAKAIKDLYYKMLNAQRSKSSNLAIVDDSLDQQLKGLNIIWRHLNAHIAQTYKSTMYVLVFICGIMVLSVVCCCACMCLGCICQLSLSIFAHLLYVASIFVYCFHYFLYVVLVQHKVWKPKHFPAGAHFAVMVFWQLVVIVAVFVVIPHFLPGKAYSYDDLSMHICDDCMYFILL